MSPRDLMEASSETVERILLSRMFWASRILTTVISLVITWRVIFMTDVIMYTPAEFLPILVVVGLICTMVPTLLKAKASYDDAVKANLRSGGTGFSFGMDYLTANIAVIVIGVVATVLIGGAVYDAIGAEAQLSGCVVMGIVAALIIGFGGQELANKAVDIFRNGGKISALKAPTKTEDKPQQ